MSLADRKKLYSYFAIFLIVGYLHMLTLMTSFFAFIFMILNFYFYFWVLSILLGSLSLALASVSS